MITMLQLIGSIALIFMLTVLTAIATYGIYECIYYIFNDED